MEGTAFRFAEITTPEAMEMSATLCLLHAIVEWAAMG
jgi:hypothetical protein